MINIQGGDYSIILIEQRVCIVLLVFFEDLILYKTNIRVLLVFYYLILVAYQIYFLNS